MLDVLEIGEAIFVGHDWDGAAAWSMAFHDRAGDPEGHKVAYKGFSGIET